MPLSPDQNFALLKDDLQTYRKIENWGLSLVLTGILLVAKQIFEWSQTYSAWFTDHPAKGGMVAALPFFIGIAGSVMLLIVNFRSRKVRAELNERVLMPRGVLGWYFAILPLGLGLLASALLVMSGLRAGIVVVAASFSVGVFVGTLLRDKNLEGGALK